MKTMKISNAALLLTFILFVSVRSYSQVGDYTGTWKFEAPDAPQEALTGTIVFTADSAITIFNSGDRFKSNWLKINNDSILFESQTDDGVVHVSLKMTSNNSMTGKADWGIGETPLMLKKQD